MLPENTYIVSECKDLPFDFKGNKSKDQVW